MYSGNAFLKSFVDMRAKIDSPHNEVQKLGATALSPIGGIVKKTTTIGPPQPLPGLGTVAKPTPEMMLKKIIEAKPGKKEVEKYFKLRCEEST